MPTASRMCFRRDALAEAEAARTAVGSPAARTGASCRSSPSIPPTPRTMTTPSTPNPTPIRKNPGGFIVTRRHRRRRALCAARLRARPRGAASAATRSISPTGSCRCCRSASPTISARCGPHEDRAALAVRMVIGADGRKRTHTFHRVLMRSAAKLNTRRRRRAIDGRPDDTTGPAARTACSSRSMPPIAR